MRLRTGTVVIATLAVVALAGCGGDDEGAVVEGNKITVQLEEQSDSGQSGTATLTAVDDERTRVVIDLDGATAGPQPAHIHENACDRIDPTPSDALKDVRSGRSETIVSVAFTHLRNSPHAINVHRSADALDKYVACGTFGEQGGRGGGGAGY